MGFNMGIMKLFSGEEVLLDDEDYKTYSKWKWQLSPGGYVARSAGRKHKDRKRIYLHRVIMECPTDKEVDHINKNILDNRKSNLRVCTIQENRRASNKHKDAEIDYKGVSNVSFTKFGIRTKTNKFRARITINGKETHLGCYNTPEEAARTYDSKAKEIYGEYARLNFESE